MEYKKHLSSEIGKPEKSASEWSQWYQDLSFKHPEAAKEIEDNIRGKYTEEYEKRCKVEPAPKTWQDNSWINVPTMIASVMGGIVMKGVTMVLLVVSSMPLIASIPLIAAGWAACVWGVSMPHRSEFRIRENAEFAKQQTQKAATEMITKDISDGKLVKTYAEGTMAAIEKSYEDNFETYRPLMTRDLKAAFDEKNSRPSVMAHAAVVMHPHLTKAVVL